LEPDGHGLPVLVRGQVGGGEGVGAQPGDRVEAEGERAAHPQHVANLVILQVPAQLPAAAVDLVAGAPRGHRLIGDGVGDDVDGQLGLRAEHHVSGDAEFGAAVGVVELLDG
jgi:hypothetical protein